MARVREIPACFDKMNNTLHFGGYGGENSEYASLGIILISTWIKCMECNSFTVC